MPTSILDVFDLPERLAAKADPVLIAADQHHLAAIAASLTDHATELAQRLDELRRSPGGKGRGALDRDLEIHRLTARLRMIRRYGLDVCLGRMVPDGSAGTGTEPVYIGRFGLTDRSGQRLLVDWRAPAAEPFFAATHAQPAGLASRRRYRWSHGRITDYWDEVFTPDGLVGHAALDDQSAFVASLGASRSAQMRDVLATIQADQDAIIRADSHGALVVDGGPGTGKTVVALHRAAYLLSADPRLRGVRGGLLFVGPHRPYLAYIADVLPSLGEEGVQTCTVRDLVAEGATAVEEIDLDVARLKQDVAMLAAVEPAVRLYEEPPTRGMTVQTELGDVWLSAADWTEAFEAPDPGTPHNPAREQVWDALAAIVADKLTDHRTRRWVEAQRSSDPWSGRRGSADRADEDGWDEGGWGDDRDEEGWDPDADTVDPQQAGGDADPTVSPEQVRTLLRRDGEFTALFDRSWTLIEAADLVGDLWTVPAYLRRCAPWLGTDQVRALQREDPQAWTVADLPLLDAARHRLGDPETTRRRRQRERRIEQERTYMNQVVDDLLQADDGEGLVQALRQEDLREALVDEAALPQVDPDLLAGPFAHIVVDEAQELTDAEWQMLLRRCPSRSFTIVGDRAQARHGFAETWEERLTRAGFETVVRAGLRINYRTPAEVMEAAAPVIRTVFPDANVPTSVRRSGIPVSYDAVERLPRILQEWLESHPDGTGCVIATGLAEQASTSLRIRTLHPEHAKGLEFDLVVLIDPQDFGGGAGGVEGAVDRYVAMTRATRQLVVLTSTSATVASP